MVELRSDGEVLEIVSLKSGDVEISPRQLGIPLSLACKLRASCPKCPTTGAPVPEGPEVSGEARTRAMVALHLQGNTYTRIGELFGISRERVRQILGNHNHARAARDEEFFQSRARGESWSEIGRRHGLTPQTIRRGVEAHCAAQGVDFADWERQRRQEEKEALRLRVRDLHDQGMSCSEIDQTLALSRGRARKIVGALAIRAKRESEAEKAYRLVVDDGLSYHAAARRLGVCTQTVHNRLHRHCERHRVELPRREGRR